MITNLIQALVNAIKDFVVWLARTVAIHIWNYLVQLWNKINEVAGEYYYNILDWVCGLIVRLIPSLPDGDEGINYLVARINAWDQILPIHETFNVCSILFTYYLGKLILRIILYVFKLLRSLLPF